MGLLLIFKVYFSMVLPSSDRVTYNRWTLLKAVSVLNEDLQIVNTEFEVPINIFSKYYKIQE